MENIIGLSVPIIVSVVYTIIGVIGKAVNNSEKFKRLIPLLALVLGSIIGVVIYFVEPELIGTSSIVYSIIVGGASGLAATGTDQIVKQLSKKEDNNNDK